MNTSSRAYVNEIQAEIKRVLRNPAFMIPTLTFPIAFYSIFGLMLNMGGDNFAMDRYLLATYGVFGVIAPALFGFGVDYASERTAGWLRLKLASPMPAAAYFGAKIVMSLTFAAVVIVMLYTLARFGGNVQLTPAQWLSLAGIHIVGVIPFCALGLAIGTWVGGTGAPAVVNLIYLPMALLSGLWIPLQVFPIWLQSAAHIWPTYHFAQLALKVIGMDRGQPIWLHIGVLIGFLLLFVGLAALGFRRGALR